MDNTHFLCLVNVKFTLWIKTIVSTKENHFPREFVALSNRSKNKNKKNKNINPLFVSSDKFSPCLRHILISNFYFPPDEDIPGKTIENGHIASKYIEEGKVQYGWGFQWELRCARFLVYLVCAKTRTGNYKNWFRSRSNIARSES